jgi:LysR family glycine cleavage system transcriptional activator
VASAYGRLPLNALRVFEAVASRLSFAEAAEALNVTPAAVSQQVRALEDYLQVPLLRRKGRKVELTPEGAALLPGIRAGLDALVAALQQARQLRLGGPLRVSTLASFLQTWIAPRLGQLHARHPDLQVDWHTSREAVDFARSDFHAAVRFGAGPYQGLEAHRLMDEWFVAVAAPTVLAKYGTLDDRPDLEGLPLLHARDEPWSRWRPERETGSWPSGPGRIDDSVSVLIAAAEGLGFAVVRWTLAAAEIDRGRIELASRVSVPSRWSYWFVCPEAYADLPKLRVLRGWLAEEAAAFRPPPGAAGA